MQTSTNINKYIRNKEERRNETNMVVKTINELKLNTGYKEVIELYKCIQSYVNDGKEQQLNIPFPAIDRRIKGLLPLSKNKKLWIKLEYYDYTNNSLNNVSEKENELETKKDN